MGTGGRPYCTGCKQAQNKGNQKTHLFYRKGAKGAKESLTTKYTNHTKFNFYFFVPFVYFVVNRLAGFSLGSLR